MKIWMQTFFLCCFIGWKLCDGATVGSSKKRHLFCYTIHSKKSLEDTKYCTSYIFAFLQIKNNSLSFYDKPGQKERLEYLLTKKRGRQDIKVFASVGPSSSMFLPVVKSEDNIQKFSQNAVTFLRKEGLDGLDVDWEVPTSKRPFSDFLKGLRKAVQDEAQSTGRPPLLLTAAVSASQYSLQRAYDVPVLSRVLDFVNLMTYDLHGSWEHQTGINAPLYPSPKDKGWYRTLTVSWAVNAFLKAGLAPEKLIMGIPLYGRGFRLTTPGGDPGIHSPSTGKAPLGAALTYSRLCQFENDLSWTKRWELDQFAPYIFKDVNWFGYDDVCSIEYKAHYVNEMKVGGAMVWELYQDDTTGSCGRGIFPLMSALSRQLQNTTSPKPACRGLPPPKLNMFSVSYINTVPRP